MTFFEFFSNIAATVIGGLVLTILFFLSREKLFALPEITGLWYFEMVTEQSAYTPYQKMSLRYMVVLWREGNIVRGTSEKIHENSVTRQQKLVGKNRTRGTIEGYIEKNYFSADRIKLHIVEVGHERVSTNFQDLIIKNGEMKGAFSSMVADQAGRIEWKRTAFSS